MRVVTSRGARGSIIFSHFSNFFSSPPHPICFHFPWGSGPRTQSRPHLWLPSIPSSRKILPVIGNINMEDLQRLVVQLVTFRIRENMFTDGFPLIYNPIFIFWSKNKCFLLWWSVSHCREMTRKGSFPSDSGGLCWAHQLFREGKDGWGRCDLSTAIGVGVPVSSLVS